MFQKTHLNETRLNQDERYVALGPPFLEPYTSIRPKGTLNEILLKKKGTPCGVLSFFGELVFPPRTFQQS